MLLLFYYKKTDFSHISKPKRCVKAENKILKKVKTTVGHLLGTLFLIACQRE